MYYARSSARPPFAKAILESGATTARAVLYPTHPRHQVQFREFLVAAGVAGVPESDIFAHLRTLPVETIVRASKIVWDKYVDSVTWPFQPVIDGPNPYANSSRHHHDHTPSAPLRLIPDLPINSWRAGRHLRIPVITGYSTNEGTMFIPPEADTNAEFRAFFQILIPTLTPADLDELEALYPDPATAQPGSERYRDVPPGKGRQWARLDAAYSDYAYICPVLQTAHFLSRAGVGHVYVYRYAATALWGTANHGDEAPVVAHDMDALGRGRPGLLAIADAMSSRFARFVASKVGSPNPNPDPDPDPDGDHDHGELGVDRNKNRNRNSDGGGGGGGDGDSALGPAWPAFESPFEGGTGSAKVMVFGEGNNERSGGARLGVPASVESLSDLQRRACRFWWDRIVLSEGTGMREQEAEGEDGRARAKL